MGVDRKSFPLCNFEFLTSSMTLTLDFSRSNFQTVISQEWKSNGVGPVM